MPETPRLLTIGHAERKCCAKCAFRHGSRERSDPYAWMRLVEGWTEEGIVFVCHESVSGHPGERCDGRPRDRVCAGFEATRGLSVGRLMRLAEMGSA